MKISDKKTLLLILSILILLVTSCTKEPENSIVPPPKINKTFVSEWNRNFEVGSPAYAVTMYQTQDFIRLPDLTYPAGWEVINAMPGSTYIAGDFINYDFTKLYVLDYFMEDLRWIETDTGIVHIVGNVTKWGDGGWTGMAGAADGQMYATTTNLTESILYTINLKTAYTNVVGKITNAPCIIDIAMTASGRMYGLDICSNVLVEINPQTTVARVIGPIGFDASYAQDMDYDEASRKLYLAAFNKDTYRGELRLADVNTGATTYIGTFKGGDELDAFGIVSVPVDKTDSYLPIIMKGNKSK